MNARHHDLSLNHHIYPPSRLLKRKQTCKESEKVVVQVSFMTQYFCYIIDVRGRDNDAQVLILDKEKRGDVSVFVASFMRCDGEWNIQIGKNRDIMFLGEETMPWDIQTIGKKTRNGKARPGWLYWSSLLWLWAYGEVLRLASSPIDVEEVCSWSRSGLYRIVLFIGR